ncbi:hypothetical protein [Burkholderia sp. LMU1-1-1.1]|uniref:hypothetical protein n=1 Tax=Burkholderia sp. LMU1-1-1.1 TaxID=3135266 RepID=UPI0034270C18
MQDRFRADVLANRNNKAILARWAALALPDGWLVAGILTSNPLTPYIDLFDQKAASYCTRWPSLRVVRGDV